MIEASSWDLTGLVEDATLYYDIGDALAHTRQWPVWRDASEFKAARDVSAGDRK